MMPGAVKMDLELFSQDGGLRKHLEKVEPAMAAKSEEFSKLESAWARYEFLRQDCEAGFIRDESIVIDALKANISLISR